MVDDKAYVTQKAICERLFLSKSTVNGLLKELKTRGYLVLVPGKNKKEKQLVLTESGLLLTQSIQADTEELETAILNWLGEDKAASFVAEATVISQRMYAAVDDRITE